MAGVTEGIETTVRQMIDVIMAAEVNILIVDAGIILIIVKVLIVKVDIVIILIQGTQIIQTLPGLPDITLIVLPVLRRDLQCLMKIFRHMY